MRDRTAPLVDVRSAEELLAAFQRRKPGYVPEWNPPEKSAGASMAPIFIRYLQAILQRLNRAPEKNRLAFYNLLGLNLVPAQAARVPVVFRLGADVPDSSAPAGTQVAAPPPPGASDPIVFETERAAGVAAAKLAQVFCLWPGRDEFIDYSEALRTAQSFVLFQKSRLQQTPHILYLAHDTLLALAGKSRVEVEFELSEGSAAPLEILWEYWDGKVWRGFKSSRSTCLEKEEERLDATKGLTRSGSILLSADCAETAKTSVFGQDTYWIRGRLTQPLPPDPARGLPVVEGIRLSTRVEQPFSGSLQGEFSRFGRGQVDELEVGVQDEAAGDLEGVVVQIEDRDDPAFSASGTTDSDGRATLQASLTRGHTYIVRATYLGVEASLELKYTGTPFPPLELVVTFKLIGLRLDKALSEGTSLDTSKPFYPLGQQPQPGAAFYFNQEEIFSKPGARVTMFVSRAESPQDSLAMSDSTPLTHVLQWEYWNGREWALLAQSSQPDTAAELNETGTVEFTVPRDLSVTKVGDQEGLWMRVRLVSGGFGFKQTVTFNTNTFTYVISQPPVLSDLRLSYAWQKGAFHSERVLAFNDFQYEDRTFEARWPGKMFAPFKSVSDVTPALYLGFDKQLPVSLMGLYLDVAEKSDEREGPALIWEYWNGSGWREIAVEDETRHLRLPGVLSFIAPADSRPLARFAVPLHWLRGRLKEDGPPSEVVLNAVYPNGVWASQQRTFRDTPLGASTGLPNQLFRITQTPVLGNERIEVRESAGARADVEWRILAMQISRRGQSVVRTLEESLRSERDQTDIVLDDLRLRRDRSKRVTEVWVRWQGTPHFFFSGAEDRHYVLDRARGLLFFGDGTRGKIPPVGAAILAKEFRAGGGVAGNVAGGTISQLLGSVPGVQSVSNPRAAEGGADGESLESFGARAPGAVRHWGRAIGRSEYETLAREASAGVAFARAIPAHGPAGGEQAGWVRLVIIPQSREPRPVPTFGLREKVRRFLEERAPGDLAGAHQIDVTGPNYLPIDVSATLSPRDSSEAGAVEQHVREGLAEFLHPLRGGPEGRGWELGRDIFLSDVAAVLERVPGVDYVEDLALSVGGVSQGTVVEVGPDRIVIAGQIELKLKARE